MRRLQAQPAHTTGHRFPLRKDEVQEHAGRQGCDGQVQPLDPQRGQPHQNPHRGSHQARQQQRHRKRQASVEGEPGHSVGTHAHKPGLPQGNQAGKAGQDVQSGGADHRDADQAAQVQQVGIRHEREQQKNQQ